MLTPSDLSVIPDVRYLKFRENYTTTEHLTALRDDLLRLQAIEVAGIKIAHQDWERLAAANAAHSSAMAGRLDDISGAISELAAVTGASAPPAA